MDTTDNYTKYSVIIPVNLDNDELTTNAELDTNVQVTEYSVIIPINDHSILSDNTSPILYKSIIENILYYLGIYEESI